MGSKQVVSHRAWAWIFCLTFFAVSTAHADTTESEYPTPLYSQPAFGDASFQKEIDALCKTRAARIKFISVKDALNKTRKITRRAKLPKKHIILSFDDGPRAEHTGILLDILSRCGIRAHFFLVGRQAKRKSNQPLIARMQEEGHMVGSHTMTHRIKLRTAKYGDARREIMQGHDAVEKALGEKSIFFRFPYGSGQRKGQLHRLLRWRGLYAMPWNIPAMDSNISSPKRIYRNIMKHLGKSRAGIFVAHDRKEHTVRMMPRLLDHLMDQGFTFVLLVPPDDSDVAVN